MSFLILERKRSPFNEGLSFAEIGKKRESKSYFEELEGKKWWFP